VVVVTGSRFSMQLKAMTETTIPHTTNEALRSMLRLLSVGSPRQAWFVPNIDQPSAEQTRTEVWRPSGANRNDHGSSASIDDRHDAVDAGRQRRSRQASVGPRHHA
jgi:hypothetical protein